MKEYYSVTENEASNRRANFRKLKNIPEIHIVKAKVVTLYETFTISKHENYHKET